MRPRLYTLPLFAVALFLAACSSAPMKTDSTTTTTTTSTVESNSIAFLTMQINRNPDGSKLTLLDQQIKPGTFKAPLSEVSGPNYLTIESYENGEIAFSQKIDHPLYKEVEAPDKKGRMKNRTTELAETQFFFRVQMHGDRSLVKIFETLGDTPRKELGSLEVSTE